MIIGWSCTKLVKRLPIGNSRWPPPQDIDCIWPSNEHFCQVWFKSVLWFQKKRWKYEIPIGSYVKLSRVMAAILNFRSANDSQFCLISSPGHRPCELLSWVSVRRPSVRPSVSFSHLNLLLWNRWTEISQTCQKCNLKFVTLKLHTPDKFDQFLEDNFLTGRAISMTLFMKITVTIVLVLKCVT
jgi:hypothetical protein